MSILCTQSRWLRWHKTPQQPESAIICFPPAGSTAGFFRGLAAHFPERFAVAGVQYPGRENRLGEPPVTSMEVLASEISQALALGEPNLVLLGHSMGAAVAFEVAMRLEDCGALIVSGAEPGRTVHQNTMRVWDEAAVTEELERLGGPNVNVLANRSLLALALPALVADFTLIDRYQPLPNQRLRHPILAFAGSSDSEVDARNLPAWQDFTSGHFELRFVDGDHFLPLQRPDLLAQAVVKELDALHGTIRSTRSNGHFDNGI